jgi:hypothetical protein
MRLELPSKRLPCLEYVVANRGRRATQNFRHFGRIQALHFPQDKGASLLRRQYSYELAENSVGFAAFRP